VTELDQGSATATADTPRHEPAGEQRPGSQDSQARYPPAASAADADPGYYDGDIQEALAADNTPTRQQAAHDAAAHDQADDGNTDTSRSAPADGSDGDIEAILHENDHLAEPRTRQEAAGDAANAESAGTGPPDSHADEPDPVIEAILHENDNLAEPRTRQQAARDATAETGLESRNVAPASPGDQQPRSGPDPLKRTVGERQPTPETPSGPVTRDNLLTGRPDPDAQTQSAHGQANHDVPITLVQATAEMRTLGDDTPTGIGLKPTGDELFRMEGDDPAESRLDRLLRKATEGADDVHDAVGSTAEAVHDFNLRDPGPGSGHAHEGHAAYEPAPPAGPVFSDLVGGTALVGVALLTGARRWLRDRHEGDRR
jgi:hypothetical protein